MKGGSRNIRSDDLSGLAAVLSHAPQLIHPDEAPAILAIARMLRVVGRIRRRQLEVADQLDLAAGDVDILFMLQRSAHADGLRGADLAATLNVTTGAISKRIQRLETARHIMRVSDANDKRSTRFRLTQLGMDAVGRARAFQHQNIISALSAEEWRALQALLARVGSALDAEGQDRDGPASSRTGGPAAGA